MQSKAQGADAKLIAAHDTRSQHNLFRAAPAWGVLALMLLIGVCAGCATEPTNAATVLRPADFAPHADRGAAPSSDVAAPRPRPYQVSPESYVSGSAQVFSEDDARQGINDVVVIPGTPQRTVVADDVFGPQPDPARPGAGAERTDIRQLQVDHLVGQVNGQPVFANEFLEPMDARFTREAERLGPQKWLEMAKGVIDAALFDRLRDELLLAEFQSTLTPEQKMGVLAFIEQVRDDLISGALGSSEQANRQFLESEGLDLNAKVEDVTQQQFIIAQLRKAIGDRVHISFVDVQRYYDRHIDEFMPMPVACFRIIRVPTQDAELIETVGEALGEGTPFAEVAAAHSTWSPDNKNLHEVTLDSRSYAETQCFGPDALNDLAHSMEPGDVSDPIVIGSNQYCICFEEIRQPAGRTLYDAQQEIETLLRSQRAQEEETRYVAQLFLRGNFSSIQEMSAALLMFASERYLIQRRGATGDGARQSDPSR